MKARQVSSTSYPINFLMVDSTDHITGLTGLSPTVTLSKNGGAFGAPVGAVSEIANGWYSLAGNATDRNTLGELLIHVTATGADPVDEKYAIVTQDLFAANIGITTIANVTTVGNVTGNVGGNVVGSVASVTADVTLGANAITAATIATDAITDSELSAAACNKIADHTLRRSWANAWTSANGDAPTFRSLLGAVAKLVNRLALGVGVLTIYEDDDATPVGTQTVTTNAASDPVTELDTV